MPTITRLSQQRKNNRVNVYLDGKFGFGVTLESALENHLKVGKELTQDEIETLRGKDFKDKIFAKLLNFASRRPHSQKEISQWFRRKEVPEELHVDLFNRLKNLSLLNDEEFARWWVEQRVHFKSYPAKMLKMELRSKGINDETTAKVLSERDPVSEVDLAKKVLQKKFGSIPDVFDIKQKKRVYDFLLRRGFSYDTIKKALADSSSEEYT